MSNPHTLPRTTNSTLSSSSSSSSSARKYRLDEWDERPILCYKYRGGLETSSQKDLCAWLDKEESLRCTRKPIPRGASYVDVKRHDLYLPDEKDQYAEYPNYDSSLASIKVPMVAYLSRWVFGTYDQLYIVSPETSPNPSLADSESKRVSPSNTWDRDSQEEEEAREGAPNQGDD